MTITNVQVIKIAIAFTSNNLIEGVHCDMIKSNCNFWAEKLISEA
jgi:hypothetical protein